MKRQKLYSLFSFFNPQSAIRIPHFSISQQKILIILALLLLGLFYFKFHHPSPSLRETTLKEFVVEVAGEVWKPGVYLFQHSPTLKETIEKAGGLKEAAPFDSDLSTEVLKTGTLVSIQKITLSPPAGEGKSEGEQIKIKIGRMQANKLLVFNLPLDLNQVSAEDLCLIPGIGESLAQEIIVYRRRRKGFRSVEELKKVRGIGEKKYRSLQTYFVVNHHP
jgi:competence protein ComEA